MYRLLFGANRHRLSVALPRPIPCLFSAIELIDPSCVVATLFEGVIAGIPYWLRAKPVSAIHCIGASGIVVKPLFINGSFGTYQLPAFYHIKGKAIKGAGDKTIRNSSHRISIYLYSIYNIHTPVSKFFLRYLVQNFIELITRKNTIPS